MTIQELLNMPIGQKIGGGFLMTVKQTKKSVQLPNKRYIHTVVIFDNTGEMLADFKDPTIAGYNPIIKGCQVKIIVAQIQEAASGQTKASQEGKKLYVDQYEIPTSKPESNYFDSFDNIPDWETITRGKIRHGIVCSFIRAGKEIDKSEIEKLIEYVFTGE